MNLRRILSIAALTAALTLVGACGGSDPEDSLTPGPGTIGDAPTTSPAPDASPDGGPTIIPTLINPTLVNPGVLYPSGAEAYAKAVVAAWKDGQVTRLGNLTTSEVQEQILEIPGPINENWVLLKCDGTAGSTYCSFTNDDGDLFRLRISHALLGQPHAAIEVLLDLTEYPATGTAYVQEFVAAWQYGNKPRMIKLSSAAIANAVPLGSPPSGATYPGPQCCGGGLLHVVVQWGTNQVTFDVGTTKLGGPAAIIAYTP